MQATGSRVPDDGKQIAADTAARRLDQPEQRVGGYRGIDRRAATSQDVDRHFCRQRLTGGRHPVPSHDFGPRHKRRAVVAMLARGERRHQRE